MSTHIRKACTIIFIIVVALCAPVTFLYAAVSSLGGLAGGAAGALGGLKPHGGTIINPPWPCTCSGGFGLIVSPPTEAIVHYQPAISDLKMYYTPFMGAHVVGQHTVPLTCFFHAGPFCIPFPSQGIIYHIGTSIPGADLI